MIYSQAMAKDSLKMVRCLALLSGYPCSGAMNGDFSAFRIGAKHLHERLKDFKTDFICATWDGVGEAEIRKAFKPIRFYSQDQRQFQDSIDPLIRNFKARLHDQKQIEELRYGPQSSGYELDRYLSPLFLRGYIINRALEEIAGGRLPEYDFYVLSRFDISTRGCEDVRYLKPASQEVLSFLLNGDHGERRVVMPEFPQLNEGYPDMWFYFNHAGLKRYKEIYNEYAMDVTDNRSRYCSLMRIGWPDSQAFSHENLADTGRFSNIEIHGSRRGGVQLATYKDFHMTNVHSYHKYFFSLSNTPYSRMFAGRQKNHIRNSGKGSPDVIGKSTAKPKKLGMLVYSHSDYFDVLHAFLGEFNRYLSATYDLLIACNEEGKSAAESLCRETMLEIDMILTYKEQSQYTQRLVEVLGGICNRDRVVLLHEDMIPTAGHNMEVIEELVGYSRDRDLGWLGLTKNTSYKDKKRVSRRISMASTGYRYVVQPAIVEVSRWREQLQALPHALNIWELEEYMKNSPDRVYFLDNPEDIKRGDGHFDNSDLPHISTAIVKGRWNISEYPVEIQRLSRRYGIKLEDRGFC